MVLIGRDGGEGVTELRDRSFQRMKARLIETRPCSTASGPDPEEARRPEDRRPHSALPNGAWTLPTNRGLHL
jgi:hypothetical protein